MGSANVDEIDVEAGPAGTRAVSGPAAGAATKNVLFVDDEPKILDGLRRMLRGQRHVWNMTYAESGAEALDAMERLHYDCIVTDMKMPGMDGATVLRAVKERHPGTVRIVLSGHADLEASMRAVTVSHQFLTKPCDAETLKEVVTRACALESLLGDPILQGVIGEIAELPVLPRTYRALTQALAQPDVDLALIGGIVEQDSSVTAKILQLVNSAFFGIRREIANVRQATTYLGVNTVRDLVLTVELFHEFDASRSAHGFSMDDAQQHALQAARIARRLLPDKLQSEQAFLAAMLHDVGKLVLAARLPDQLDRTLAAEQATGRPFHVVEREICAADHAAIGAYLLTLWGMPYPVVEAVAHHHEPSRVPDQAAFGVLGAVHVANALARDGASEASAQLDEAYLERLGVLSNLTEWRTLAASEP